MSGTGFGFATRPTCPEQIGAFNPQRIYADSGIHTPKITRLEGGKGNRPNASTPNLWAVRTPLQYPIPRWRLAIPITFLVMGPG